MAKFESEDIFERLNEALNAFTPEERSELVKQVGGTFEFQIKKDKSADAPVKVWHAEVKSQGVINAGAAPGNPDVTLFCTDEDMVALATGELSGARAFISDRIGLRGPMMMAMKLDVIFRSLGLGPVKGSEDDLSYDGFESSFLILQIAEYLKVLSEEERKAEVAKVKGIFLFNVKKDKQTAVWMMDMKNGIGQMKKGKIEGLKPDITLELPDKVFVDMFMGKLNGQKAFMSGKIKVKGQIMLALKLDNMMKETQDKIGFFKSKL
ncbi:hypothetical protein DFQ27_009468 [Actinomortierella ambigua]|uniref:SCP2 domain-containing protein n=1 Tax=Actinomortierella ambigua TaxID=1343610 RepID=A0A9P6PR42_9FUNG|nr:hypothetical protein DFQ27_009468 [Actinomortierella ambigua]